MGAEGVQTALRQDFPPTLPDASAANQIEPCSSWYHRRAASRRLNKTVTIGKGRDQIATLARDVVGDDRIRLRDFGDHRLTTGNAGLLVAVVPIVAVAIGVTSSIYATMFVAPIGYKAMTINKREQFLRRAAREGSS